MRIALVGQPNSGKSTLFNQVAGYKAETGNFSGTTVTFTESKIRLLGEVVDLVDLPGTYTLSGSNEAEREVFKYLKEHQLDLIINLVDATHLQQALSLTNELIEVGTPMILGLNMIDEASRSGVTIDINYLEEIIGLPVVPLIANRGMGIKKLFITAAQVAESKSVPKRIPFPDNLETAINELASSIPDRQNSTSPIAMVIRQLIDESRQVNDNDLFQITRDQLEDQHRESIALLFARQRREWARETAERIITLGEKKSSFRDRVDDVLLHPILGYITLLIILGLFFEFVFIIGNTVEGPLLEYFDGLSSMALALFPENSLFGEIIFGILQGLAGGIAIVIPYLTPFLFGLGILEDVGYLPRIAYLMDSLMTRMGLHGKAIVPFILGYGCNVPAVMSTRMMENRRDKFLAATLATLVPCAARLSVVFGLVAFYLGPMAAFTIYMFNILVIGITGRIVSSLLPETTPGLILEIPVYRVPSLRSVFHKVWFRGKEFIVEAWPILIIGSVILSLLEKLKLAGYVNILARPVTWALGLPSQTGVPLIFGILRKELSLVMLRQALAVEDFSVALDPHQMIAFAVFVVFYVPCLATLAALKRELGRKDMLIITLLTVVIALIAGLIGRWIGFLIYG